jgi:GAF domain
VSNRWFRFVIALLALAAAGAAGYRIFQQEQVLARDVTSTRAIEQSAESAMVTISELKAALHAYVAAGQGHDFWTARAGMLLDKLRATLLELDGAIEARSHATEAGNRGDVATEAPTGAGVATEAPLQGGVATGAPKHRALTEALDLSDRLAASEQRARDYVRGGQTLVAGDVIFTEARDLLDGVRIHVARARDDFSLAGRTRLAGIRQQQVMLAIGALGVMTIALLLLVTPATKAAAHQAAAGADSGASASAPPMSSPRSITPAPSVPSSSSTRSAASAQLREAASVCTELGRVSQSVEISPLLDRAANVLSASGIIVWMSSTNRDELFPVASSGYDERMIARIGSILRMDANLTAAAFREGAPRTSAGLGPSPAALAVPLLTPQGPVGVLSAELRESAEVDADRLALATIFAAQLSTLLGSMASTPAEAPSPQPAEAANR